VEDIECLCPECISSGEAARKYDGSFQDDCSVDDGVEDPARLDELIHRTPGYCGWQQEYWRTHCGDYCAYLGHVGARELRALGVLEDVLDDPMWDDEQREMIQESVNGGHLQCYLFQCLHCGSTWSGWILIDKEVPAPMEKISSTPLQISSGGLEIDGHTIRTCLNGGKVKEILCDSAFQVKSKAASAMMSQMRKGIVYQNPDAAVGQARCHRFVARTATALCPWLPPSHGTTSS
jgi:hypothetical protein